MKKKYDQKIIDSLMNESSPEAVDNEYILEDVLLKIQELNENIANIEAQKQDAINKFDNHINSVQKTIEFLKQIIMLTCDEKSEESFKFDGIGVASKSKGRTNWIIQDKDQLRQYLLDNLTEEERNDVFIPQPDSIAKKKLDAILDRWEREDALPECVEKVTNEPSLKIRFSKPEGQEDNLDDVEF